MYFGNERKDRAERKQREAALRRANSLYEEKEYAQAAALMQELLQKLPHDTELRYVLAASLVHLGQFDAARREIAEIRAVDAAHAGAAMQEIYIEKAHGHVRTQVRLLRALIAALEKRIARAPRETGYCMKFLAEAYSLLGSALTLTGETEEAVRSFVASGLRETMRAQKSTEYSNALFAVNYLPEHARGAFRGLLRDYQKIHEDIRPLASAADAARGHDTIRIGYISPDLCRHPVAYFLYPLLHAFDQAQFSVYCYARCTEDAISLAMQQEPIHWRNIMGMSAAGAAARVRRDAIDILVDLSGHTKNNCLPVLAHKPAPVQMTGIGYFDTTGLSAVDYMLSDGILDPEGTVRQDFTEEIIRLPHSHFCYLPLGAGDMPQPAPPPMAARGYVTFGCFNNFSKVTDEVLLLWRQVLDAVPKSRLLVKSKLFDSAEGRAVAAKRFVCAGISEGRVEMRGFTKEYLNEYADMDIALDTFPYTGGLTTCEALYMGVPVVTLCGKSHGGRFGASLLTNANLEDLVAKTPDEYVRTAAALAGSLETLTALRENLRTILQSAPLMDVRGYVQAVEAAYRAAWERFVGH